LLIAPLDGESFTTGSLSGVTFSENVSINGAGLIVNGTILSVTDSHFLNNQAVVRGVGSSAMGGGKVTIHGSLFTGNTAGEYGGGVYLTFDSEVELHESKFAGNQTSGSGGAGTRAVVRRGDSRRRD
jgi:hypothetical protein